MWTVDSHCVFSQMNVLLSHPQGSGGLSQRPSHSQWYRSDNRNLFPSWSTHSELGCLYSVFIVTLEHCSTNANDEASKIVGESCTVTRQTKYTFDSCPLEYWSSFRVEQQPVFFCLSSHLRLITIQKNSFSEWLVESVYSNLFSVFQPKETQVSNNWREFKLVSLEC